MLKITFFEPYIFIKVNLQAPFKFKHSTGKKKHKNFYKREILSRFYLMVSVDGAWLYDIQIVIQ